MFKVDFQKYGKDAFTDTINQKVLLEICSEARQRIWKKNSEHVFIVKNKEYKKPQDSAKGSRKRLLSADSSSNSSKTVRNDSSTDSSIQSQQGLCVYQQNVNGTHLQTNTQPFNPIVASHHGQNSDVFDVVSYENNNKTTNASNSIQHMLQSNANLDNLLNNIDDDENTSSF